VLDDGYADKAAQLVGKDRPWGPFSGGKYSALEAGTRMPTIVYWPEKVKPGMSNALFSQVDLYASMAALVGHELQPDEAPDSYDMLDVLLGKSKKGRTNMLEEAYTLALRSGDWKYIAPQTKPTPGWMKNKDIATGLEPYPQLYDLKTDTAEKRNVAKRYPDQAATMQKTLEKIQQEKGSRPGYQGS
jgi:arylsulfatase A-like enzyme